MCWRVIQGGGSDGEGREAEVGSDGEGGSWGVMEGGGRRGVMEGGGEWSGVREGGGLMRNDGGRRQWWGLEEGEGVVCWASHFVCGPSIFVRARSSSFVRGLPHLLSRRGGRIVLVVCLVICWGSLCPRALVVRGSGLVVVRGWRVVHGGLSSSGMGYHGPWVGHHLPWVGLVVVCR